MTMSTLTQQIRTLHAERAERTAEQATLQKEIEAATLQLEQIEAKIRQQGQPDYRDVAALDALESLKRQRQACATAIEKQVQRRTPISQIQRDFVIAAIELLISPLQGAQEALIERCARDLAPYFATPERAREIAQFTDAARSAYRYIENLISTKNHLRSSGGEIDPGFVDTIERLLAVVQNPKPDITPFLRPYINTNSRLR